MTQRVLLIRHAQASFGEDNYDRLSALGHRQADALGLYLEELGMDRIVSGDLVRHQETVQGILRHAPIIDTAERSAAWNEFDHREVFFAHRPDLLDSARRDAWKTSLGDAYDATVMATYREALVRWMSGASGYRESWLQFRTRVKMAWEAIQAKPHGVTVVVSSAGPLSVVLGEILGWTDVELVQWQTQFWNSGVSELALDDGSIALGSLNHCPHLVHHPDWMTQK